MIFLISYVESFSQSSSIADGRRQQTTQKNKSYAKYIIYSMLAATLTSSSEAILVSPLVTCNIYVSAGRSIYKETLISLLEKGQNLCQILREQQQQEQDTQCSCVSIIHAFSDSPYNRSSFHVAGFPKEVTKVASFLAINAMQSVEEATRQQEIMDNKEKEGTLHPFVGVVDHVSVMPLLSAPSRMSFESIKSIPVLPPPSSSFEPPDVHGRAAYEIGRKIQEETEEKCNILYYGSAHENNTPLHQIRREFTSFFHSGGSQLPEKTSKYGTTIIGSPTTFVENFNIRLNTGVSRKKGIMLSQTVRERDGPGGKNTKSGIPGVEALTLIYSNDRFEVACNLLNPSKRGSSSKDVWERAKDWEMTQNEQNLIECGYRVGTTEEMCLDILLEKKHHPNMVDHTFTGEFMEIHDDGVKKRFEQYIDSPI